MPILSRRRVGAGLVAAALLACAQSPAAADFQNTGVYPQHNLTTDTDAGRMVSTALRADGALIVSEEGSPLGDGYLHMVPPRGGPTGPGNRFGSRPLEIAGMTIRGGYLYGLSAIFDEAHNAYPLYEISLSTGEVLRVVTYWGQAHALQPLVVNPSTRNLVLQDQAGGGAIVEIDPATGGKLRVLIANPPALSVEAIAFDPATGNIVLGNSQADDPRKLSVDGLYVYSPAGAPLFSIPTTGSPDGVIFGLAGTCFAGKLLYTTETDKPNAPAGVATNGTLNMIKDPASPADGAQPTQVASTPNDSAIPLWMIQARNGDPVVSHNTMVDQIGCPNPPPQHPPAPPPAPAAPQQPAPPAPHQAPPKPPASTTVVADKGAQAGLPALPGPPGTVAPQTAPVPASQPVAQVAGQSAPNAGVMDAPEDDHAFSLSASARPAPPAPFLRLALGATFLTAVAAATYLLTNKHDTPSPAGRTP